ncbi:MAG TPA: hypothetical protein VKR58_06270 [Aquella sp.]|nr:hypothetical protein [Aquella sp.]
MKFRITETRTIYDENYEHILPPCKEAKKEGCWVYVDRRTCKTPEEFNKKFGPREIWEEKGTNHRIIGKSKDQMIARDFILTESEIYYTIELNTLEELLKFSNNYGNLVFGSGYFSNEENPPNAHEYMPWIEIYNDYRE